MKKAIIAIAIAAPFILAGCISTDMGTGRAAAAPEAGVNAERGTGSNLTRRDRDTRQNVDREELERLQRPGGSNQIGKSGKT